MILTLSKTIQHLHHQIHPRIRQSNGQNYQLNCQIYKREAQEHHFLPENTNLKNKNFKNSIYEIKI